MHVTALKNWTVRKLRALVPGIGSAPRENDPFYHALRDPEHQNLVFLGDLVELDGGHYCAAPTRLVDIDRDNAAVISGQPTSALARNGFLMQIRGIARHARRTGPAESLPRQTRESYVGRYGFIDFTQETIRERIAVDPIAIAPAQWLCYQGNRGWGFSWGNREHSLPGPLGTVSLWHARDIEGDARYQLRITAMKETKAYTVPPRFYKQVCLWLDALGGERRTLKIDSSGGEAVLSLSFAPPEASFRWLGAVGAQNLGFDKGRLRWSIPESALISTVELFGKLPIRVEGFP